MVARKGGPARTRKTQPTAGPSLKALRARQRGPRRPADNVTAICLNCSWRASGPSWRPIKRQLREHKAKRHKDLVA